MVSNSSELSFSELNNNFSELRPSSVLPSESPRPDARPDDQPPSVPTSLHSPVATPSPSPPQSASASISTPAPAPSSAAHRHDFPELIRFKDPRSGEYIFYKRLNRPASATSIALLPKLDSLCSRLVGLSSISLVLATNFLAFAVGWLMGRHSTLDDF